MMRRDLEQGRLPMAIESASRSATDSHAGRARWIVLRVMTGRERAVDKLLSEADVECWLPVREGRKTYRKGKPVAVVPRALMPGYLLVRCAVSAVAIMALARLDHVIGILGGYENPLTLSDGSVARFRERVAEAVSRETTGEGWLLEGAAVAVEEGPFAGFEGRLVPFHRHVGGQVKMRRGPNVLVRIAVAVQALDVEMPLAFIRKK